MGKTLSGELSYPLLPHLISHIPDLEGHGIKRVKKFAVKGRLKDIDIKDVSHGAIYPNVCLILPIIVSLSLVEVRHS